MKKILLCLLFAVISFYSYAQQCNTPLRIVVLGSSTAWGNGVPSRDSAWTFRYLRYLKASHGAGDTVIILAKGGNTTHTIQATGTPSYTVSGVTFQVDTTCNISRAFSLNPSAIIVNIPNEDEARSFPINIQIANLLAIRQLATAHNVPLWVATTQPRNNLGYASGLRLLQMKDSVISLFGTKAIDFMTDLADNRGYILPAYNSGDDALLNASGQKILFDRVVAKQLPQVLCGSSNPGFQLSGFNSTISGQKIQLNWSTFSEISTLRFGIERSTDSLTWINTGYLNAAGNSNSTRSYSYTDSTVTVNQFYFYRLNMETTNNQHTFGPVIKTRIAYFPGITLSAFNIASNNHRLLLSWSTTSETASLRFNIERSTDTTHWSAIGIVNGAGNSTSTRNYTFSDSTVIPDQLYYYRLNHETTTGMHSFSQVVSGRVTTGTGNCNKALKVVVLGSSTAWGNGLPDRDSAWTQRYARYLKQYHNNADTLILKAIGSSTTQNMMPSGTPGYTVPATGLTYNVDTSNNITKAISYQPDFIIINMPSNDEARSFPLSKQVENFRALKQAAADNNIPLWVTTSQPRSNLGYVSAQRLAQLKDSINLIFGDKAIDFWSGLGLPNGYMDSIYNSGDDVHFNAAGQRILFERVVAKNIPAVLCGSTTARNAPPVAAMPVNNRGGDNPYPVQAPVLKLYPNPATSYVNIPAFCETPYLLEVYNSNGTRCFQNKTSGSTQLLISNWPAGIYYVLITHGTVRERLRFVKL